ncbi:MAG: hypothetical protein ACSLEL_01290 [Candidatus Malihini olakiniferum]
MVGLEGGSILAIWGIIFCNPSKLPARLFIRHGSMKKRPVTTGILLQLPLAQHVGYDKFNHLAQLTAIVKNEELFTFSVNDVLYCLYDQGSVTLYEPDSIFFIIIAHVNIAQMY